MAIVRSTLNVKRKLERMKIEWILRGLHISNKVTFSPPANVIALFIILPYNFFATRFFEMIFFTDSTILRGDEYKIDYFIESAPCDFLFTSRKTLETNE